MKSILGILALIAIAAFSTSAQQPATPRSVTRPHDWQLDSSRHDCRTRDDARYRGRMGAEPRVHSNPRNLAREECTRPARIRSDRLYRLGHGSRANTRASGLTPLAATACQAMPSAMENAAAMKSHFSSRARMATFTQPSRTARAPTLGNGLWTMRLPANCRPLRA